MLSKEMTATLVTSARAAAKNSHSPYSHFSVGAAVLDADGTITPGTNVENASYGLTCCAERSALFGALSAGHKEPVAIAVTCPDGDTGQPTTLMPCGACRQVIAELLASDAPVIVDGVRTYTVAELLPQGFKL